MRLQNNIIADNSHRQLGINNRNISVNTEKLSSGYRVNRAADDAAGLAISEKMRTQIRGLNRASLNIQDGISLLQVGDGALQSMHDKMQRLRELSVQSANDTNQLLDREAIQLEFGELASEMNQIVQTTNFNGRLLFDGSIGGNRYNLGNPSTTYVSTISGEGNFGADFNLTGWTIPPNFGTAAGFPGPPAAIGFPGYNFPNDGVFAIQIMTPVNGTYSVVLDFEQESLRLGRALTTADFENYFLTEFNKLSEPLGENLVESVRIIGGEIQVNFPRNPNDSSTLIGIMGHPPASLPVAPPTAPRVIFGAGTTAAQLEVLSGTPGTHLSTNRPSGSPELTPPDLRNSGVLFSASSVSTLLSATGVTFPSVTLNAGSPSTTVRLMPGNYKSIEEFVEKNKNAFATATPRSFNISVVNGKLSFDTNSSEPLAFGSPPLTVSPAVPLAALLGLDSLGTPSSEVEAGKSIWIQAGANSGDGINLEIPRLCTRSLGISIRRPDDDTNPNSEGFYHSNSLLADGYRPYGKANVAGDPMEYSLDVTTREGASAALSVLTNAINIISTERARIGAQQNRLEYAMQNVDNSSENLQAAESRIRDVDMAAEMTTFVQNQILQQASTAMLAQANALPNSMLQLLG